MGNCCAALISLGTPEAEVTSLERIDLSDICSLWATGGIRARLAGSLETSDFMSDRSSSNWLRTWRKSTLIKFSSVIKVVAAHLVEDSVGWFVASQAFLGEMLMALSQALNLSKPKNKVISKFDAIFEKSNFNFPANLLSPGV